MTRIKAIILALLIEYHWWYIKRGREQFEILYNAGFALNSPQIHSGIDTRSLRDDIPEDLSRKIFRDHRRRFVLRRSTSFTLTYPK